jgi:hypothetical protein
MNKRKCLEQTIKGFHIMNSNPIVERNWEEVFVQAQKRADTSNSIEYVCGNHGSGSDCTVGGVSFSNKTSRIRNGKLSISSYRLTGCRNNLKAIVNEIDNVRKNFDYYALLAREELPDVYIYRYYKIPSHFFMAKDFTWAKKYTRKGKFSGWKTHALKGIRLDITECMSSQLWIHLNTHVIAKYLENTIKISREQETMSFAEVYELVHKHKHSEQAKSTTKKRKRS